MLVDALINDSTSVPRALRSTVVTGGNSGLGAAVITAIRAAGGWAASLDRTVGEHVAGDEDAVSVDVSDRSAVERAIAGVVERRGSLTSIVTSAGIDACGRFEDVDAERWNHVIGVNLIGTANVIRAALPHLRASGGRIVTVASTLGLRALSDATAYCASKFGVVGFTRALAAELKGEIGVTLLVPGGMATAFFDGRAEQYRPGPDAKLNAPRDVASAVVFALSQAAGCDIKEMVVCPATESSWP